MAIIDILTGMARAQQAKRTRLFELENERAANNSRLFARMAENPNYAPEQQEWFAKGAIAWNLDPKYAKKNFDINKGQVAIPVELMAPEKAPKREPMQAPEALQFNAPIPNDAGPSVSVDQVIGPQDVVRTRGFGPVPLPGAPRPDLIPELTAPDFLPGGLKARAPMRTNPQDELIAPPSPPPALMTPVAKADPARRQREAQRAAEEALRKKLAIEKEFAEQEGVEETAVLSPGQTLVGKQSGRTVASVPVKAEGAKGFWVEMDNGQLLNRDTGEVRGEAKEEDDKWLSAGNGQFFNTKTREIIGTDGKKSSLAHREVSDKGVVYHEYYDPSDPGKTIVRVKKENEKSPSASGVDARADDRRIDTRVTKFGQEPIVKRFNTVTDALQFVRGVPDANNNPAYDQALIYAFAKAMDPDSVVREGEYATVQKYAQSWIQNFGFNAQRVLSNSEFLSASARANMKKVIEERAKPVVKQYDNLRKSYADQINKITGSNDGESYLTDYGAAFEPPPPAAASTALPKPKKSGEEASDAVIDAYIAKYGNKAESELRKAGYR